MPAISNMPVISKYNLGLCEIHCGVIHGGDADLPHYLVIDTFTSLKSDISETDSNTDTDCDNIFEVIQIYQEIYLNHDFDFGSTNPHSFIRNYENIIFGLAHIKPEIMLCIMLDSGHYVAILKTFWIRIIQRTWKKVFRQRQIIISKFKHPDNLNYMRLTGKSLYCVPGLKGMLQL